MIDRTHPLSVTRQAVALGISRGAMYYRPRAMTAGNLALACQLDHLHLHFPFVDARMLRRRLRPTVSGMGRRRIGTVMHQMGVAAFCPQPGTSHRYGGHPNLPYLLRHPTITRQNEIWAIDITHVPMAHGFLYQATVLKWSSRRVLRWRVSITQVSAFCIAAVEEALAPYGYLATFNTDQGAQFTSAACTGFWQEQGTQISMDGKSCLREKVFIGRLWRSLKHEEAFLDSYSPRWPAPRPATAATAPCITSDVRTRA